MFLTRNQTYGAYQLRRSYATYQLIGLAISLIGLHIIIWSLNTEKNDAPPKFEFENSIEFKGFDANLLEVKPLTRENKPKPVTKTEEKNEVAENPKENLPPEIKKDAVEKKEETVAAKKDSSKLETLKAGLDSGKYVAGVDSAKLPRSLEDSRSEPYGGLAEFQRWVQSRIVKPKEAIEAQASGSVYVYFTIDKEGNIKNVKVQKGFGYGCDEEVVRVVSMSPKWKPQIRGGYPTESRFSVQIFIH